MALKATIDKAVYDSLPDEIKKEYSGSDGSYTLQVEAVGGLELTNPESLRRTLGKERQDLKDLKALYDRVPKEVRDNPEAAVEALSKLEKLGEWGDEDKRKEALRTHELKYKAKFEKDLAAKDKLVEMRTKQALDLVGKQRLTNALLKQGLFPECEDVAVSALLKRIKPVTPEDGDVDVEILDLETGTAAVTRKPGETGSMTFDELVSSIRTEPAYKPMFATDAKAGGGNPSINNNQGGGNYSVDNPRVIPASDQAALDASVEELSDGRAVVDFEA